MSNIEHLLENAISEIKAGNDIDDFKALWHTPVMLEGVSATAEEIWKMAMYVVYTHDEPKRGYWVEHRAGRWESTWSCSECDTMGSPQWKCCPVCTAFMGGKGDTDA